MILLNSLFNKVVKLLSDPDSLFAETIFPIGNVAAVFNVVAVAGGVGFGVV